MTNPFHITLAALVLTLAGAVGLPAQNAITFGTLKADPNAPVEVTADTLAVNQADGSATFTGNVVIVQGAMRLGANEVRVEYAPGDKSKIQSLIATGNVVLTSGPDTAGADQAAYAVSSGRVEMTGNVLLTQAGSTIAGQSLSVDLKSGTGEMSGRVRTVLDPGKAAP